MKRSLLARILIAIVVFFNLQCAAVFMVNPQVYAPGFEVEGIPGQALVRGMGILFVMWNIPYLFALWNPIKNRLSLHEASIMQAVGVVGESLLLFFLPGDHPVLVTTANRFILFDAGGLVFLLISVWITHPVLDQGKP